MNVNHTNASFKSIVNRTVKIAFFINNKYMFGQSQSIPCSPIQNRELRGKTSGNGAEFNKEAVAKTSSSQRRSYT